MRSLTPSPSSLVHALTGVLVSLAILFLTIGCGAFPSPSTSAASPSTPLSLLHP